ncbi:TPM domain-containing protein [Cellulomonas shaoxiangyii]|uniref:TPM domain-containing protein n=1 Tax=Cellulomonas shaoxiangyii TaxID=2566013 RepID=UPI001FC9F7A8|nr:TPM domain-containing protein [Cellulomonas shaoxiangyii]
MRALRGRVVTVGAGVALGASLLMAGAGAAAAVPPPALREDVTDESGVLSAGEEAEVQAALDQLAAQTDYQLYVVYVPEFTGAAGGTEWAQAAAEASQLGADDVVLAVATETERYALVPESAGAITAEEMQAIARSAEDDLRAGDWAGAAVTTAEGVEAAATGNAVPGAGGGGGGFMTALLVGLVVIGGIFLLTTFTSRRRKQQPAGRPLQDTAGATRVASTADEFHQLPTAELDRRSAQALVRLDDALRSSEEELGFAQAQFGAASTREFETVLVDGKQRLTEAFRLRQTLDDDIPDTEEHVRGTSAAILRLCREIGQRLDEQKEAFDQLRAIEERVDDALDAHEREAATLRARVAPARAALSALAARYPASALTSVAGNPDQAELLLGEVGTALAEGRQRVAAGERSTAVGYARAAEEALGQVRRLLDAVDTAGEDLAAVGVRLENAVASITSDLSDAARLARGNAQVEPRAIEAREAVAAASAARSGQGDPLAALRRITAAEAAIDEALAPMRQQAERSRRAQALLDDTLGRLESAVRATADYVSTRRGAVGPQARTRLAEADRLRMRAADQRATDPEAALATAQQGEQLVAEAQRLAQVDVENAEQMAGYGGGYGPGGYGGRGYARRGGAGDMVSGVGGMVLGGILLDSILRGGGGFGGGGGWGGGGDGGGFDGGGFGDGGFDGGF